MKLVRLVAFFAFLLLLTLVDRASAGGGVVGNGGDLTEIEIINTGYRLSDFMATSKGREVFPEVDAVAFRKTVENTLVKVSDEGVADKAGVRRSAINYRLSPGEGGSTVIKFDRSLFENTWKDQSAEQVMLVLHEYLNLMGLELTPAQADFSVRPSSIYPLSSRILPYIDQVLGVRLDTIKNGDFLRMSCVNKRTPKGTGIFLYPNGTLDYHGRFYLAKRIRRKHFRTATHYKGQYEAIQFKNGNELNIFFKKERTTGKSDYYSFKVLYAGDNQVALGYLEAAHFDFRSLPETTRHRKLDRSMPMRCVLVKKDQSHERTIENDLESGSDSQ